MKELQEIFRASRELQRNGSSAVLATIVSVHGSTYRRPGARMLINREGRTFGLISGGCIEGDIFKRSQTVFETGQPDLISYDTRSADDLLWGFGLGCTGLIEVLLERIPSPDGGNYLQFLERAQEGRRKCAVATLLTSHPESGMIRGAHLVLDQDGTTDVPEMDASLSTGILTECRAVLAAGETRNAILALPSGELRLFVETIPIPPRLLIFGAGADTVPLIRFAKDLGWSAVIIDNRPAYLNRELFPLADRMILADPGTLPDSIVLEPGDLAVVMTHNYHHDLAIVRRLLSSRISYIGLLGPKSKSTMLLKALADEGISPTPEQLARLYTPVGIDIGAESPEEIALAIVSEMQAAITGRPAGSLRNREGSIHR